MIVELIHTVTSDGVRLHGALHAPESRSVCDDVEVDAVILTHGVGSNFYGSVMMDSICRALHGKGVATLRINTRGHDSVTTVSTADGPKMQGAAYEQVDACRMDLAAWTDCLLRRDFTRVGWLGHSLGAIKVLYAQAHRAHEQVRWVVAISPPRLAHSVLIERSDAFKSSWAEAQRLRDEGRSSELFLAKFPFPILLSAATFCDKYGPDERYNILRFSQQVTGSVHLVFGELELNRDNVAFARFDRELAAAEWGEGRRRISIVGGANHFYSGRLQELNIEVCRCL